MDYRDQKPDTHSLEGWYSDRVSIAVCCAAIFAGLLLGTGLVDAARGDWTARLIGGFFFTLGLAALSWRSRFEAGQAPHPISMRVRTLRIILTALYCLGLGCGLFFELK